MESLSKGEKRLRENADCPSSSRLSLKYKQRKISAIRDFPAGCGPNAPSRVNSASPVREKVLDAVKADAPESIGIALGSELYKDNRSPADQDMADSLGNLVEQVVASAGMMSNMGSENNGVELLEMMNKPVLEMCGKQNEVEEISLLGPDFGFGDANSLGKNSPKNKFRQRRVSAIRDFPPFCGSNAPQPSEEDRLRITGCVEDVIVPPSEEKETVIEVNAGNDEQKNESKEIVFSIDEENVGNDEQKNEKNGVSEEEDVGNAVDEDVKNSRLEIVIGSEKDDCDDGKNSEKQIQESMINVKNEPEITGKEIVLYSPKNSEKSQSGTLVWDVDRDVVVCLVAGLKCPWRKSRGGTDSSKSKTKKRKSTPSKLKKPIMVTPLSMVPKDEEEDFPSTNDESPPVNHTEDFNVNLPPFGPNTSHGDARNRVREVLRLFQAVVRKLLQREEAKSRLGEKSTTKQPRIDLLAAKIVREKGKEVNSEKHILGAVPGVEIGDEFQYRVELAIVGIHRLYQGGIDYKKQGKELVAVSIVASGGYNDDVESADTLIYSGQGGVPSSKDKLPEDQKLERGNLALKNSIDLKNPVRVVRGSKETKTSDSDSRGKLVATYVYDGLYTVERYWQDMGPLGKLVFKFELKRVPGQRELAWKEVKKSKKVKLRTGVCADDISGGKEVFPVCAFNTIDNEKPPPFTYITSMMFPDHYSPIPPKGCDCIRGCVDSKKCSCAVNNGGELPFNHNGAIVEAKTLVYECGPSCKCSGSCHNRVSQHGMKIQLEIFKTESRGWGVRSIHSISSGSFICEYIGELLDDREAEQRTGNDEYLFDIGQNLSGGSLGPDSEQNSSEVLEEVGYTIDAVEFGNIGRFINHSCSPNLYAQNVIYDNEDTRIPHIMFFAAENIPPLQELTYHYNYSIDQVRDSNGNIKKKSCYCGSAECTGRLY